MNYGIFVPTYKRKEPLILKMLDKDPNVVINLCVRAEEIEAGFYDELANRDRVNVIDLGYGLSELGQTRQRILEYCHEHDIKYCCQIDDGIFDIYDNQDRDLTITEVLKNVIHRMKIDELSEYVVGFTFVKHEYIDPKTGELVRRNNGKLGKHKYFLSYPGQAVMLDVEKIFEYNLHYGSLNDIGFEDAAFFGDTLKEGLVWASDINIGISGVVPNVPKAGGSHADNFKLEEKYDKHNKICYDYLNMMGVHIEKKYHGYASSYISFLIWDFDYYRDVLTTYRKQNSKIIKSRFSLN